MWITTNEHLNKLLTGKRPGQELRVQYHSGVLATYLPEVAALYGVPQRAEHHPEIDVGWHMELCLDQGRKFRAEPDVMLAILLHDLGKGITPKEELPRHHNHESTGIPLVGAVCDRLGVDVQTRQLVMSVCENHIRLHSIFAHRSNTISQFVHKHFEYEDFEFAKKFVTACWADASGRLGKDGMLQYNQGLFLLGCVRRLKLLPMPNATPSDDHQENVTYRKRIEEVRNLRKVHDLSLHLINQKVEA